MKKITIAVVVASTWLSFATLAQQPGFNGTGSQVNSGGGFQNAASGVTTTARVKSLRDDSWVILEGKITGQTKHEHYQFNDSSGSITVEIDDEDWYGQRISQADKVHIEGEVEKDWDGTEIHVKSLRVIK